MYQQSRLAARVSFLTTPERKTTRAVFFGLRYLQHFQPTFMTLVPGSSLGPYQIEALAGAGAMGEVYRARDTRLDRTVAIKILPAHVAAVPGLLQRFEREARAIAAVEHLNICPLYDVGAEHGVNFLVMQFIEGETLADRISRGPIPVGEAIALAQQIAAGLDAAHAHGIVHRDLKPSNIRLTSDHQVKLVDFGLAKAMSPSSSSDADVAPTVTASPTEAGAILGTAAYMSPEQARGQAVDKRTDIWAFGGVLFEMLTGRRPFPGQPFADVLAAVVGRDPDWSALPPETPRRIRDLLRRCLQKDPARRLRDIGDARLELDEAAIGARGDAGAGSRRVTPTELSVIAWTVAALALAVAAAAVIFPWRTHAPRDTVRDALQSRHELRRRRSAAVAVAGWPLGGVRFEPRRSMGRLRRARHRRRARSPDQRPEHRGTAAMVAGRHEAVVLAAQRVRASGHLGDAGVPGHGAPHCSRTRSRRPGPPTAARLPTAPRNVIWICDADGANARQVTKPEPPPMFHDQPAFVAQRPIDGFHSPPAGPAQRAGASRSSNGRRCVT